METRSANILSVFSRKFFRNKKKVDFGAYDIVVPGKVSPLNYVPSFILKPSYYETGLPSEMLKYVEEKTEDQREAMRQSCKLAANILKSVEKIIKVGVTTDEIDKYVHNLAIENRAYPSPLNYKFFPKSVCTSVNNVVCHGIPDDRKLQNGDIINVDITVFSNGYHGDCSKTFLVGDVDQPGRTLVDACKLCLQEAILICKPGVKFSEVGKQTEMTAKKLGFKIVPAFIGHGIGHYFHGPPNIYHKRNRYPGVMKPGVTFTIEPAISQGTEEIDILDDGWTAVTADSSRSAQFEHTVLITENGVEILTLPD